MPKIGFSVIPLILIILLSVFFFLSPNFFSKETANSDKLLKEVLTKKFISIGNSIAHASFVEDAILMDKKAKLNEIITNLRSDEPEMTFIHFTNDKNKVITSSDSTLVGKIYNSNILASGTSVVREKDGIYEGGFSIQISRKKIGALYFKTKPSIPTAIVSTATNPIILAVGIGVALIVFFITFTGTRALEKKLVDDINKRQEEVFAPKIEVLKNEQAEAQKELEELNDKLKELNNEYEAKKKELETNPVFQSIDKLKATETGLLTRIETLKEQEAKFDKEVELLTQKREEIRSALEAEKKEESILHEKLTLIKKKILRLETPDK